MENLEYSPKKNKLTLMLSEGSDLVKKDQLNEAVKVFTKVIELDPNWAEAWNKRATVLSIRRISKVAK